MQTDLNANTKIFEWTVKRYEFSTLSSAMKSSCSRLEIFCIAFESANNLNWFAQQTKFFQQTEHAAFFNALINSDNDCDAPSGII